MRCDALRWTRLSVKAVAAGCGYSGANYFCRIFREATDGLRSSFAVNSNASRPPRQPVPGEPVPGGSRRQCRRANPVADREEIYYPYCDLLSMRLGSGGRAGLMVANPAHPIPS